MTTTDSPEFSSSIGLLAKRRRYTTAHCTILVRNVFAACSKCGQRADPVHLSRDEPARFFCGECCPCFTPERTTDMNNPNVGRGVMESLSTPQEIKIADWKTREKNTLRGFFTAILPSGIKIRSFALHEKDGSRWINSPRRSLMEQGQEQFEELIGFTSTQVGKEFQRDVLAALDAHFAAMPK